MDDPREAFENTIKDMAAKNWKHPVMGIIQYAMFCKLFFEKPSWQEIWYEVSEISRAHCVHEDMVELPNGDVVVTIFLVVS
jgi:hypothetical protein